MGIFYLQPWVGMALAFSFVGAVIIGFNQHFQVDGRALVMGRVVGVLPLAVGAFLLFPWPVDVGFYVCAAGMGLLLAAADMWLMDVSRVHGGRLAALYVPLKMLLAFGVWGVLEPASVAPLLEAPWRMGAVGVGFGLCAWALGHLRACDTSWPALVAIAPVAGLFALGDVVAKGVLPPVDGVGLAVALGGTTAYLLTTMAAGSVVVAGQCAAAKAWPVMDAKAWAVSAAFGVLIYGGISLFLLTLSAAPNPGYVAAVTMMSSVWLAAWGKYTHGEHNNWGAALLLVLGGLVVAWASV